jgi:hypothetical protein
MHPELESLLRAYENFRNAPGVQAERLETIYHAALADAAGRFQVPPDALDRAIKNKYLRWIRASSHPSTLPPRA